jgi:hypothetical protein
MKGSREAQVALERLTLFRFYVLAVAGVAVLGAAAVSGTLAVGATRLGLAGALGFQVAFVGMTLPRFDRPPRYAALAWLSRYWCS